MSPRVSAGMTLIELLVAMALGLLILLAATSFQQSTMRFSSTLDDQSRRLGIVTDVAGYLGSRIREAADAPDAVALGTGGTTPCQRTATLPCLAVLLPKLNTAGTQIASWQLHTYRFKARSTVPATDKVANSTLDAGTTAYALYQEVYNPSSTSSVCTGTIPPSPSSSPTTSGCFASALPLSSTLLLDNISLARSSGTYVPFTVNADRTVTLQVRIVSAAAGKLSYSPALTSDPYSLTVQGKNLP